MVIGPGAYPLCTGPQAYQFVASHPLKLCLHVREVLKRVIVPYGLPLGMVVDQELKEFGLKLWPFGGGLMSVVEPKVGPHIAIQVLLPAPVMVG